MKKIFTLIFSLLFIAGAFAQKKTNPVIGKKEIETSLFIFSDDVVFDRALFGVQINYRWPWKKFTKLGVGGLAGVDPNDNYDPGHRADFAVYGSLFGDITQFMGQRQKWSVSGQVGHGIYNKESSSQTTIEKDSYKISAGMYYLASFNYRAIISKKILIQISPFWSLQNFRHREVIENFSTSSIQRFKYVQPSHGEGLKIGIVF